METGEKLAPVAGTPVASTDRETMPLNPRGTTLTMYEAAVPRVTVCEPVSTMNQKSVASGTTAHAVVGEVKGAVNVELASRFVSLFQPARFRVVDPTGTGTIKALALFAFHHVLESELNVLPNRLQPVVRYESRKTCWPPVATTVLFVAVRCSL